MIAAAGAAQSCATPRFAIAGAVNPARGRIVDVHCHLFNSTDLPAARFIKIVFLGLFRKEAAPSLDIEQPDFVDALIALFLLVLGQGAAPTADQEAASLRDGRQPRGGRRVSEQLVADATAEYLLGASSGANAAPENTPGRTKLVAEILAAGAPGDGAPRQGPLTPNEANEAAGRAMRSDFSIGRYLRWFALFVRARASLADQLAAQHRADGFSQVLLCPALIDYDAWLDERVRRSPLRSQVHVMGQVALRSRGPAVHGYVAFDPLRQLNFERKIDRRENPINLVREALTEYGFLGVKLYPPMGFRASGNLDKPQQRYPEAVDAALGGRVGDGLNAALDLLYETCVDLHAPIIAHASASNEAGPNYALRADPAYWLPVFERWPALHVCLAHFGSFAHQSAATPETPLPLGSWEYAFGDYIRRHPESPVFADLSFFTEIAGKSDAELSAYADTLLKFMAACDPDCRHLVFGSDWIMLGNNKMAEGYAATVFEFFKTRCNFDAAKLERLFSGNAARFLGLRDGDPTRDRLLKFYAANGANPDRLPQFDRG